MAATVPVIVTAGRQSGRDHPALDHPVRRRIFELLRRVPGRQIHDLGKALNLNRQITRYHVFYLVRAGMIESSEAGGHARFFPANTKRPHALAALLRKRALEIADTVAHQPGLSQGELVDLLKISRRGFRETADRLIAQGLIVERRRWRELRYYPTERLNRTAPTAWAIQEGTYAPDEPGPE